MIPETIEGYPVTSIGTSAFYGCRGLTSISIPESVTHIERSAFFQCENIVLYAKNGYVKCYAIENNLNYVIDLCFIEIKEKQQLYYLIENSEVSVTLCNEDANGELIIPETIEGYPVTSIGDHAFYKCNSLASIIIPSTVTSIGKDAFGQCSSLTNITIPSSVINIGDFAFYECNSLTSITIPEGVTSIEYGMFSGCINLNNITISEEITSIERYAFSRCRSLTSVTIPEGVTSIAEYAFERCSNLMSVIVPSSITVIGNYAFLATKNNIVLYVKNAYAKQYAIDNNLAYVMAPASVEIKGELKKTRYCPNENFDIDGLTIIACYDDGNSEDVTDKCTISGFDSSIAGKCVVTVSYEGFNKEYEVTILQEHVYDNMCDESCNVCGAKRSITHSFGNWKVVKQPTAQTEGLEKRICSVCSHEEVRSIERLKTGTWKRNSIGWWYQNPDGTYPANCWKMIDNVWYYFNASGYILTGWQVIGGTWYYFNTSGAMVTGWQAIGGTWYYFNESGAMMTGWQSIGGTWYYFNGSGAMVTGWQAIGGTWYYFDGSGAMMTGWQLVNGRWYYLHASGAMAANQWVGNYYLQGDGSMATNKWIGGYYVGADGKWIP